MRRCNAKEEKKENIKSSMPACLGCDPLRPNSPHPRLLLLLSSLFGNRVGCVYLPPIPTGEHPLSFVHMYQPHGRVCNPSQERPQRKNNQRTSRSNAPLSLQQPRGRLFDDISDPRDHLGGEVPVAGHEGVTDRGEVLDLVARETGAKDDVLELRSVGDLEMLVSLGVFSV